MTQKEFVAEYSVSQGIGHVQPLTEAIAANTRAVREGRSSDWVTIHVGSYEVCHRACRNIKKQPTKLASLLDDSFTNELAPFN